MIFLVWKYFLMLNCEKYSFYIHFWAVSDTRGVAVIPFMAFHYSTDTPTTPLFPRSCSLGALSSTHVRLAYGGLSAARGELQFCRPKSLEIPCENRLQ